jgi:apolipoprotein N-acyltransferase
MRKSRLKGAEMFVNLTNDGWYPDSRLGKQHFDHARVRTVENGVPLVRACNSGFTAAIDCLGRVVTHLSEERRPGLLVAHVPTYHFTTLYSCVGDLGIVTLCVVFLGTCFYFVRVRS